MDSSNVCKIQSSGAARKPVPSKGGAGGTRRTTRTLERVAREEEERAAEERGWQRQLNLVSWQAEYKLQVKKGAWGNLQTAERARSDLQLVQGTQAS